MPTFRFPSAPSLRNRQRQPTRLAQSTTSGAVGVAPARGRAWPSPYVILRGPGLLLRGPRLLLRAPGAVLRAPGRGIARTQRLFSSSRRTKADKGKPAEGESANAEAGPSSASDSFTARLRRRLSSTPTTWYPIPVSLGVALLVVINFYKQRSWESRGGKGPVPESEIKVKGPWQVHVLGALPLRSMSRIYGMLNSYTLPVWFRVPGYKFYAFVFGVNLDECEPSDLTEYRSMSEFFMRRLKAGARPIADVALVSPADGRVVNFGTVEGGLIEQVKGSTYSLGALLSGTGEVDASSSPPQPPFVHTPHPHNADQQDVDEAEFADINGIPYSLNELLGPDGEGKAADASLNEAEQEEQKDGPSRTITHDAKVALDVASSSMPWSGGHAPRKGNKLFYTVIYLAPGDYHRFHSPTNWVVERRRHFAGELFSVSPWMANKLQDLFVLNERVALLGRWRHGFFSMVPVGATNVGSIRVNFDSSLRTNSPLRPITPGTFSEATYAKASSLLGGQPLQAGDEVGGFWLGSTIVLVFEAPDDFEFGIHKGQTVKVGEKLGDVARSE